MIILFLTRLYLPHIGGVERHISGLVKELVKNPQNQVILITEKYSSELKNEEIISGARVIRLPVAGVGESAKKWVIWNWFTHHQDLLNSADIIHVHDVMFWLYPYKLTHPARKIYLTLHGWEGVYPVPFKNKLHKKFDSLLASANICVGDYLSKWYGVRPNYITYGAVSPPPVNHKLNSSVKILLFLGRLDEDTGFAHCLNLFRQLPGNLKLVIAGSGPLQRLIPPDATYLGPVSDPEKQISQADCVYTSGYLGILESFIQKKIVLTGFSNPLKKDYLMLHPMSKYFVLDSTLPASLPEEAYNWSKAQTWSKLANLYLKLWSK